MSTALTSADGDLANCARRSRPAATSCIKSAAEKILNRARLMQEGLSGQVEAIVAEVIKLKDAAATE